MPKKDSGILQSIENQEGRNVDVSKFQHDGLQGSTTQSSGKEEAGGHKENVKVNNSKADNREERSGDENAGWLFEWALLTKVAQGCQAIFYDRLKQDVRSSYTEFRVTMENQAEGRPAYSISLVHPGTQQYIPLLFVERNNDDLATSKCMDFCCDLLEGDGKIKYNQIGLIVLDQLRLQARVIKLEREANKDSPKIQYSEKFKLTDGDPHDVALEKLKIFMETLSLTVYVSLEDLDLLEKRS